MIIISPSAAKKLDLKLNFIHHQLNRIEERLDTMAATLKDEDDAISALEAENAQFLNDIQAEVNNLTQKLDDANTGVDYTAEVTRINNLINAQKAADPNSATASPPVVPVVAPAPAENDPSGVNSTPQGAPAVTDSTNQVQGTNTAGSTP